MDLNIKPLTVVCDTCGKTAETWDFQHPDLGLSCDCCPVDHDHAGLGCRTITVYGTAHLSLFNISELMEMAAEREWDSQFDNLEVKN